MTRINKNLTTGLVNGSVISNRVATVFNFSLELEFQKKAMNVSIQLHSKHVYGHTAQKSPSYFQVHERGLFRIGPVNVELIYWIDQRY